MSRQGQKVFLVSTTSQQILGPTEPSFRREPGFFPRGKVAEAWSSPPTFI